MNFYKILFAKQHGDAVGLTEYEKMFAKYLNKIDVKTLTGTLPLYVRSRASQILQNYIIYGTASGAGVETENLWDGEASSLVTRQISATGGIRPALVITTPGTYTIKSFIGRGDRVTYIYGIKYTISTDTYGGINYLALPTTADPDVVTMTETVTDDDIIIIYDAIHTNIQTAAETFTNMQLCVTSGSTAPSSYIPHGYKLPITVTSNGTTTDYPVYIGDSQLGEEEYVDYEEQKIYKLVDGTLTPTDPPVPLPDIALPQGIVTIDTEEEVKPQATVKGKIEQIT